MSITRSLLTSATLLPLLAACQVYTGKPEGPPPATRLQGQVQVENGQLVFTQIQIILKAAPRLQGQRAQANRKRTAQRRHRCFH